MPTFEVRIIERSYRSTTVEVDAEDWEQAEDKANAMYHTGGVDFEDSYETEEVEFEVEEEVQP
jgi:hypothetical protein